MATALRPPFPLPALTAWPSAAVPPMPTKQQTYLLKVAAALDRKAMATDQLAIAEDEMANAFAMIDDRVASTSSFRNGQQLRGEAAKLRRRALHLRQQAGA